MADNDKARHHLAEAERLLEESGDSPSPEFEVAKAHVHAVLAGVYVGLANPFEAVP